MSEPDNLAYLVGESGAAVGKIIVSPLGGLHCATTPNSNK